MWITPIYDRTASDVAGLKSLAAEIRSTGWTSVTQAQRDEWLNLGVGITKGALNVIDLNRIQGNVEYVHDTIDTDLGIPIPMEAMHSTWGREDIPFISHINAIRNNIIDLLDGSYTNPSSPTIELNDPMDWDDINDIEQNLHDLKEILDAISDNWHSCGTYNCGQATIL